MIRKQGNTEKNAEKAWVCRYPRPIVMEYEHRG